MPAPDTDPGNTSTDGHATPASCSPQPPYHLFSAFGVELEYAIARADSLSVSPTADQLLQAACGHRSSDFENGPISWSNELPLHVIELKTSAPVAGLSGLADLFQANVCQISTLLRQQHSPAVLLPTAMHPWMDPARETRLWQDECGEIYQAFNRVFNCSGHGWSNLQSVHLNLPFASDDEFARLHAAIRIVLPLLPALAASSPVVDGKVTGFADTRLHYYGSNSAIIPQVTGLIIPEPACSAAEYESLILQPMYQAVSPYDPEGILQHPFLNARGAIARFDRQSIEIRVLDIQECPVADLAVLQLIVALLQALVEERWGDLTGQNAIATAELARLLQRTIRDAELAHIDSPALLQQLGISRHSATAGEVWNCLAESLSPQLDPAEHNALQVILSEGPLSRRILSRLPPAPDPASLQELWGILRDCLQHGRSLRSSR